MSQQIDVLESGDFESSLPKYNRKGQKIVYMTNILYACFKMEMKALKEKWLETTSYQSVFKFQVEAEKLGNDYGITVNVRINPVFDILNPDITIDVLEEISLIPASEEEYKFFTNKVYGHDHISDLDLFNKRDLTSREVSILDGEIG